MKYLYALSLISFAYSSVALAEEITIAQPIFPEQKQETQLEFTPPNQIGEVLPSTEEVSPEKTLLNKSAHTNTLETPIVLGKNGELVFIQPTKAQ